MHFEWDALKSLSNRAKHDIDFETVSRITHFDVVSAASFDGCR